MNSGEALLVLLGLGLLFLPIVLFVLVIRLYMRTSRQGRELEEVRRELGWLRRRGVPAEESVESLRVTAAPVERERLAERVPELVGDGAPEAVVERRPVPTPPPLPPRIPEPRVTPIAPPPEELEPIAAAVSESAEKGVAAAPKESLELRIGGKLFNRIGIGVLVIGVVLVLRHIIPSMSGWGTIASVASTGLALLAGGLLLERRHAYAYIARGLAAGGWAVLYSLTFAVHNLKDSKIHKIEDPLLAFSLLALVAAGMIGHALLKRTPAMTALAFAFAVVGMTASPVGPWVPVAVAILGVAQIVVSRFPPYPALGPFAIVLTYGAQLIWMVRLLEDGGSVPIGIPWMLLVQALVFAASGVRKATGETPPQGDDFDDLKEQRAALARTHRAGLAGLVNLGAAFALIIIAHGDIEHPGPWWFPAFLAGAALAEAALRWNAGRRLLVGYSALAATVLTMTAFLWGCSAGVCQVAWLVVGLAVTAVGRRLDVPGVAVGGAGVLAVTVLWILALSLGLDTGEIPVGKLVPEWTLLIAVAAMQGFRTLTRERFPQVGAAVLALGSASFLFWVWREAPHPVSTVLAAVYALVLWGEALWQRDGLIRLHACAMAILAGAGATAAHLETVRLLSPMARDLPLAGTLWGLPAPIVWTVVPAAVLTMLWWVRWPHDVEVESVEREGGGAVHILSLRASLEMLCDRSGVFVTVALLSILALLDTLAPSAAVSVAWTVLAFGLVLLAPFTGRALLTALGLLVVLAAAVHVFFANMTLSESVLPGLSLREVTVVPIIFALVALRLRFPLAVPKSGDRIFPGLVRACGVMALVVAAALASYELSVALVAPVWAIFAIAGIGLGSGGRSAETRDGALTVAGSLLLMVAAIRGITVHPQLGGEFLGVPVHLLATLPVALVLILAGERLRFVRRRLEETEPRFLPRFLALTPRVYPALLTLFIGSYIFAWVSGGWLTFSWSLEATVILALGFLLDSRSYRYCALALVAFCLGKVFIIDLAGLAPEYRMLSFIVLGLVMIGISFLYTRYRHRIVELLR